MGSINYFNIEAKLQISLQINFYLKKFDLIESYIYIHMCLEDLSLVHILL
jgi:cytochrome c oxidase subunit IV